MLRGLHYQIQQAQGKLVRAVAGEVFDVTVDIRRSSPTFGRWDGVYLSAENKRMLWVPPGFAHGFVVLSESAEFLYKTTDYWYPEHERCIRWDDPALGVQWPIDGQPILAAKDAAGKVLAEADVFEAGSRYKVQGAEKQVQGARFKVHTWTPTICQAFHSDDFEKVKIAAIHPDF